MIAASIIYIYMKNVAMKYEYVIGVHVMRRD